MDELILDNKKYVSSKRAARITGYAPDYVGQLCRSGKIDARLVGRTWYVNEDALINHRSHSHKQDAFALLRNIQMEPEERPQTQEPTENTQNQTTYDSTDTVTAAESVHVPYYGPDTAPLIPIPVKKRVGKYAREGVENNSSESVEHHVPIKRVDVLPTSNAAVAPYTPPVLQKKGFPVRSLALTAIAGLLCASVAVAPLLLETRVAYTRTAGSAATIESLGAVEWGGLLDTVIDTVKSFKK